MGSLGCLRSGLAGVDLQGNGLQLFSQCLFPVWGAPGFCWEQDDAFRLAQGCSAELAIGIVGSFNWQDNSSAQQLLPPAAWGWGVPLNAWQEILAQIQPRVQPLIWHITSLSKGAGMQGGLSWSTLQGRVLDAAQPMGAGTYWPQKSHRNRNPEVHPRLHCFSLYRPFNSSGSNKNLNNSKVKIKFLILPLFSFWAILTSHFSLDPGLVSLFKDDDTELSFLHPVIWRGW